MQQRCDTVPRLCDPGPGSPHPTLPRDEANDPRWIPAKQASSAHNALSRDSLEHCHTRPPRRRCRADSWAKWLPLGPSDACSASPILTKGRACCDTSSLTPHAKDTVSACSTSASTPSPTTSTACSRASTATSSLANNVGSPRPAGSTISAELRKTAAACSLGRSPGPRARGTNSIERPRAGGGMHPARLE